MNREKYRDVISRDSSEPFEVRLSELLFHSRCIAYFRWRSARHHFYRWQKCVLLLQYIVVCAGSPVCFYKLGAFPQPDTNYNAPIFCHFFSCFNQIQLHFISIEQGQHDVKQPKMGSNKQERIFDRKGPF